VVSMTSIEQTGRTIEEATEIALKTLGVTEDEVDIEILDEGSRGFLGLGQTPARVRVSLKSPERKRETATVEEPAQSESTTEAAVITVSAAGLKAAADKGKEVLQEILDRIDPSAKAEVKSTEDAQVVLDIKGGDAGILIGRHGQTINAIQYLVSVIANKQLDEKVRIIVDAGGYRARREEALRQQALYLAKKVRQSGQEAVLEALQASERRIIHLTLANDPDVYTYSEGEEPDRRVVISPRK